jgi:hypothetical protein
VSRMYYVNCRCCCSAAQQASAGHWSRSASPQLTALQVNNCSTQAPLSASLHVCSQASTCSFGITIQL